MVGFIRADIRHCIGADANWVVALALVCYTETFGHLLPGMKSKKNFECFNEFLDKWMRYGTLIDPTNPASLYDNVRNGLAHEYAMKLDSEVNMGTGPCGIEIVSKGKKKHIRFNIITYFNDFMEAAKSYQSAIKKDKALQKAFDERMKGKPRLR